MTGDWDVLRIILEKPKTGFDAGLVEELNNLTTVPSDIYDTTGAEQSAQPLRKDKVPWPHKAVPLRSLLRNTFASVHTFCMAMMLGYFCSFCINMSLKCQVFSDCQNQE